MILIAPPKNNNWDSLQNKPAIFSDNQIHWSEIQGIPERISFLATNIPGNWQPWILSDFYSQRLEWMGLTSSPNAWTMVQRDGNGKINGTSFKATALPLVPDGLSAGNFYRDTNGFVKVVM
ncbi:hypothetical protein PL11201_490080 [Planktothrix sp. PCC 11201]|uniref:hypothetical protein n=1 Tax=Planktothrix sp. PCC 11201 TaxID=1729650 RepID=UPI00091EE177|nr:hypothetical protein [Planktothrix sp. PCC 11201]SKB11188.1 hypothetical protein PL11201_110006 [Planktothrix sp. PCC 11201]SKB13345.1 hypothetical protein PL11201_490080 [Planktothrix sp. PCC 11201]